MSSDAIGWAIRYSPYKGANYTIHCMMGDTVNDANGNTFWMSVARLAEKSRCERKTATRGISTLLEDGFITLLEERPGGTNLYQFEFPDVLVVWNSRKSINLANDGRQKRSKVGHGDPPKPSKVGQDVPPLDEEEGGTSEPTTRDTTTQVVGHEDPGPGSRCPTNSRELELEHQEIKTLSIADEFDLWWRTYPRKIQKGKAFSAFKARRKERVSFENLLQARDHYVKAIQGTELEFTLYPATFLNKHNWKEWIDGSPEGFKSKRGKQPLLSQPLPEHSTGPKPIDAKDFFGRKGE